jgi:putative ABC transport system permease protein
VRYLPLLWAGLFRKRTRTSLTLASIAVAFLLFGLLQAVRIAFEAGAENADTKRLLTTARYSLLELLPISYLRRIEQVPGVVGVTQAEWFSARYQNESNAFPVFAVDPARYLDMYPEFTIAPEQRAAFAAVRTGAIAGARLVARYGWRLGQKLPLVSGVHPRADGGTAWEFDLVGILDTNDLATRGNTDMVLIGAGYFDEARQFGRGRTGWYITRVADSGRARVVAAEIDDLFANSPDETRTQPEKEFAVGFARQIGDIGAIVMRILVAVFFTILILTANAMAQSIRERVPEFAILKTVGFSDGKVTMLVLAEAALLLLIGGALGMAAATGVLPFVNERTGGRFPPLVVEGVTWLRAAVVALALALAVGVPPALRARRLRIVDALSGHR